MAQLQQQQNQQEQNPETYDIVVHYTNQRLQREGFEWVDRPAGQRRLEDGQFRPYSAASEEVHSTMRRVTDEFEQRFAEAFEELSGQLEVEARDSAYQTFQGILGATFQEGVSWSRIVALMCLNGALASKCVALHMPELGERGWGRVKCETYIEVLRPRIASVKIMKFVEVDNENKQD